MRRILIFSLLLAAALVLSGSASAAKHHPRKHARHGATVHAVHKTHRAKTSGLAVKTSTTKTASTTTAKTSTKTEDEGGEIVGTLTSTPGFVTVTASDGRTLTCAVPAGFDVTPFTTGTIKLECENVGGTLTLTEIKNLTTGAEAKPGDEEDEPAADDENEDECTATTGDDAEDCNATAGDDHGDNNDQGDDNDQSDGHHGDGGGDGGGGAGGDD